MPANIELGLGIIGLGKSWGHIPGEVPAERAALELLKFAYETGIRYFDSAPSYGIAEERLGRFLRSLDRQQRAQLRIATKFGEHWDAARQQPFVDHSFDALRRSIDAACSTWDESIFCSFTRRRPKPCAAPTSTVRGSMRRNWECRCWAPA